MNKDLNFVSRYRATRKRFTRASFGGVGLMLGGITATPVIGLQFADLSDVSKLLIAFVGVCGSVFGMLSIVQSAENRQKDFMAGFYGSLGINLNKVFKNEDFSEGAVLDEFGYTFPDGRRGLVSVIGTGEGSEPRVVFSENASAKVLESPSTTAKEITA